MTTNLRCTRCGLPEEEHAYDRCAWGICKGFLAPTRDAAEGAGDENPFMEDAMRWVSHHAPSKPAPDAMRKIAEQIQKEWPCCAHDKRDAIVAALSAPVSPANGIMEATPAQHVGAPKGEPAKFVRNGNLETCRCSDCRALSPSPAVAAEPVAWRVTTDGYKSGWFDGKPPKYNGPYELAYAAPSVRGDRETIAKIINPQAFDENYSMKGKMREQQYALERADAILSLRVQPGREAFYSILSHYIPQQSIDQAWQELREAGLVL